MTDDLVTRLPKNVLPLDCGCVLYLNSPKNHGVTLHCKDHRTKPEIENDEEGLQETVRWQANEIERLRALSIELINSITEMAELGLLPKMTVRMNEAGKALDGAVHSD